MNMLQAMGFGASFVVSVLVGDLLRSHERPAWPHAVVILGMALVGGYLTNVFLVACMLGAAFGWLLIGGIHGYLTRTRSREQGRRPSGPSVHDPHERSGSC